MKGFQKLTKEEMGEIKGGYYSCPRSKGEFTRTYNALNKTQKKTDKFRHSPALENTRLWCLVGQTFLRSSIQGRFPVSTSPPAYGQRQRTHGE